MKQKYLLIVILLMVNRIFAQPGTLDQTFGEQGKVLSTTSTGFPMPANSIIVKKDDAILIGSGEGAAFLLKQFLNNGAPDSSFGNAGEARTVFKNYLDAYTTAVGITEDNKIVAAGTGGGGSGTHNSDILLAKYLANGKADSSFGVNGSIGVDLHLIEVINCMKITNQGKILVAGYCAAGDEKKDNCFLAEFNSDGSIDTNFGDSGKVITDVDPFNQSYINSIAVDPDGSIITAGSAKYIPNSKQDQILLAKYTVDGKLETNFGTNGLVFTDIGSDADYGYAVALQNDAKIVVAGAANYLIQDSTAMVIVRYNNDGSLDKSFNSTGALPVFFGNDNSIARALLVQPNGNYIIGGVKFVDYTSPPNYAADDFAVASITKDGKIDSSFGTNGITTTDFSEFDDGCDALALQQDGKIIAAGGSTDVTNSITYITLARYNGFLTQKQILITKIKKWFQHHNGFMWDANSNISNYIVQRSYDGTHFNSITKINAGNNSNYTYQDPSPLSGANYYRLQTTSTNGAVNYSNVIAVTNSDIKISPNPATNSLHIEGLSNKKVRLSVVDFSGNIKLQTIVNNSTYNLNIASLKSGNYLLKIESQDDVVTKAFVKE